MVIRILLFGPEAAALQREEVTVTVPEGASWGDLRSQLGSEFPALAPGLAAARFAVNGEFVPSGPGIAGTSVPLREGDEIALIGLVSGG
jgi:molybdopterin converting factor small subunit